MRHTDLDQPAASPGSRRWLALVLFALGICRLHAAEAAFTEYQVKALFLCNFAKYVEWPADSFSTPAAPIVIGVLGENKFGDELQKAIAGASVNGRKLVLADALSPDKPGDCQIVFISASERKRLAELLPLWKGRGVLLVGETDQFAQDGGTIGFVKKGGKVRLEINLNAARSAGLQLSSKLLNVADRVLGQPES